MIKMSQQLLHFLEFLLHVIIALNIFSVRIKLLVLESEFFVISTQKLYHNLFPRWSVKRYFAEKNVAAEYKLANCIIW